MSKPWIAFFILNLIDLTKPTLLDQCYSSGSSCVIFKTGKIDFSANAQITLDDIPNLSSGGPAEDPSSSSQTSSKIKLNTLLSKLLPTENGTLSAMVISVGTKQNVQWKISPDSVSEHQIEISNKLKFEKTLSNVSIHCFDISNDIQQPEDILVVPPDYRLFFSSNNGFQECGDDDAIYMFPFVWDNITRAAVRGVSYFSISNCSEKCIEIPTTKEVIRLCPRLNERNPNVQVDAPEFVAQMSDDLFGITIKGLNHKIVFPIGIMGCEELMENSAVLGQGSICLGDGENVAIKFGTNPTLMVWDLVKVRNSKNAEVLQPPKNAVYPNFTVAHQNEVVSCTKLVRFEVKQLSGNGQHPLKFKWRVLNGTDTLKNKAELADGRVLELAKEELSGSSSLQVSVCNIAGKCTDSEMLITQFVNDSSVFSVDIEGYEQETPNSFGLHLRANPTFQQCNSTDFPKNVQYEWLLDGEVNTYDEGVKLPAYKYDVNQSVNITLIARFNREKYYSSRKSKTIHYVGLPLLVSLDCVQKQVAVNKELVIYSFAQDFNRQNTNLKYSWSCANIVNNVTSEPCTINNNVKWNQSSLYIPAMNLNQNHKMNFTLTVKSENDSDSASCIVSVGTISVPTISFHRMTEKKHNVNDYIRIQGTVSSSSQRINITWEIVRSPEFGYFNITSILSNPTTIIENVPIDSHLVVSLTIPPANNENSDWVGLLTGKTFVIRLWATNNNGASYSDLYLYTNSPPTIGIVDVSSSTGEYTALETSIVFAVGDGWNDDKDDFPLNYRFGYKTYYSDNTTSDYWFSRSTVKLYQMRLPSASVTAPCGNRVHYSALLSVCDRLNSCSSGESEPFEVQPMKNTTLAILQLMVTINSDVLNGNLISAIAKLHALNLELCTENYDQDLADKITLLLFKSLAQASEAKEYQEAFNAAQSLLPIVSTEILTEVVHVLSDYRKLLGNNLSTNRKKRAVSTEVNIPAATTSTLKPYQATESEANDMLKVYDILIAKDKPVIDVYFLNINDFVTGFCMQLGENADRVMTANGSGYTIIQSESVNPNLEGYRGFSNISAPAKVFITFSENFNKYFSSWNCGPSYASTCRHVCIGTAFISQSAMMDSSYMNEYLFLNQNELSLNKSTSDLYEVNFVDPLTGSIVSAPSGQIMYSIAIPVTNYKPINYYDCFMFITHSGWDASKCMSSTYATSLNNQNYIKCSCSSTGILGVFLVNPPPPIPVSEHNEILLTMVLDVEVTSDDIGKVFARLSQMAEVEQKRFVKITNRGNKTITATLRPPFKPEQKSNSYAVQSIQKAIGYQKLLNVITVQNFSYQVVQRALNGDTNARKIQVNLNKSYVSQLGNDADDYAKKWATSIATALQISEYRLKNYKIFFGIIFNFTITVPFTDEAKPLSADEIALMIQECSQYNEIDFGLQNEAAQINPIQDGEIVKLIVVHETNALMISVMVVLSAVLGFGTLFIMGAVVVKVRTDRLIEEERRRAILNEHFRLPPPPEYPNNTGAFTVGDQYPHRRLKQEVRHH